MPPSLPPDAVPITEHAASTNRWLYGVLCSFIIGGTGMALGYTLAINHPHPDFSTEYRLDDNTYKFINPLLDYQTENTSLLTSRVKELETELENYFEDEIKKGNIKDASVYYRDLNNGPWFSVNEEFTYTPASLLKIPLLISYLKLSESDPTILDKTITYEKEIPDVPAHNIEQTPSKIMVGSSYTVKTLLEIMVLQSDNIATILLQSNIDGDISDKIYTDFGVTLPNFVNPRSSYIKAREYASFFRILYNSTYLSRANSEYALSLLSKSEFVDGIHAGVPEGVVVSNKFGAALDPDGVKQLHDCGIIYDSRVNPYILCIMTRGNDYAKMSVVIREATKSIHDTLLTEAGHDKQ